MAVADQSFYTITAILFASLASITIVFSITTISIIRSHWHSQCRSVANLLTCNSAAALLFYAISIAIQIPLIVQLDPAPWYLANPVLCRLLAFLLVFATSVKTYSYMVQAITQFFITTLHQHRSLQSFRFTWLMIVTSWLVSVIIAAGIFISPPTYQYEFESHLCTLSTKNTLASSVVIVLIFFVSVSTVMILYGIILYRTIQHSRRHPTGAKAMQFRRNIKVFKKILLFTGVLIVSGTPYLLSVILHASKIELWPLYSTAVLFISLGASLESMAVLLLNDQVRKLVFTRVGYIQTGKRVFPISILTRRNNQISPRRLPETSNTNMVDLLSLGTF